MRKFLVLTLVTMALASTLGCQSGGGLFRRCALFPRWNNEECCEACPGSCNTCESPVYSGMVSGGCSSGGCSGGSCGIVTPTITAAPEGYTAPNGAPALIPGPVQ